jgi:large subunit ribosomal protein L28
MSRRCEVCGKGTTVGNNVSHSNIKTKRQIFANLQTIRVDVNGHPKKMKVCTSCIKSNKVKKYHSKPRVEAKSE